VTSTQQFSAIIERPGRSRCQTRMMLERVSSGPSVSNVERRLFECAKCDHVEISILASDPFKSKAAGWLAGEPEQQTDGSPDHARQQEQGPQCTACGSAMKLAAIEPSDTGQDLRTYSCSHCRRVQRRLIDSAVTKAWLEPQRANRAVTYEIHDGCMIPKSAK
jgi:hypothetical protein